jgi:hypothetical protein
MRQAPAPPLLPDTDSAPQPSAGMASDAAFALEAWAAGQPPPQIATALGVPLESVETLLLTTFFDFP